MKKMENLYDVIVVGGGPSGLSAAIYLARAKYRVLVIEKEKFGGQITITSEIVNYPGVEIASGKELTESMKYQAEDFGAEFLLSEVKKLFLEDEIKRVVTSGDEEYLALGIVLALGASPRKIGFKGEKEFQGRGVAYCATCDGEFFTNMEVLVIGGGFAAVEESIFLTKYAKKVTIIVREPEFTCAAGVVEKLKDYPMIETHFHTEIVEVGGDHIVSYARLKNNKTNKETEYRPADGGPFGIFVFAGYTPATELVKDQVLLNEQGYIVTNQNQETSIRGVYAAGDVCIKELRQVVTAVSDGAVAATSLEKYVSECRKRLDLPKTDRPRIERSEKNRNYRKRKKHDDRKESGGAKSGEGFIENEMKKQLQGIFSKFQQKVIVAAVLGNGPEDAELSGFADELSNIHENVMVVKENTLGEPSYLDIRVNNRSTGIRYYSVPGGHEFNSFIIALYNTAGPGQQIDKTTDRRIRELPGKHLLQVMTTLSCTNCPEVVMGTQKIASLSPGIEAEMYDLAKFPEFKEKYRIMAVPCLVVDKEKIFFGKRNLEGILEIVEGLYQK